MILQRDISIWYSNIAGRRSMSEFPIWLASDIPWYSSSTTTQHHQAPVAKMKCQPTNCRQQWRPVFGRLWRKRLHGLSPNGQRHQKRWWWHPIFRQAQFLRCGGVDGGCKRKHFNGSQDDSWVFSPWGQPKNNPACLLPSIFLGSFL